MAGFRGFLLQYKRVIFIAIIALFLIAAIIGITVVKGEQFPDWYMHLGMWGILGAYLLIVLKGLNGGRKAGPVANLVLMGLFGGYWIYILKSVIPQAQAMIGTTWKLRPELDILWAPIVLLALVWVLVLVMTVGLWGADSAPLAPKAAAPAQKLEEPQQEEPKQEEPKQEEPKPGIE